MIDDTPFMEMRSGKVRVKFKGWPLGDWRGGSRGVLTVSAQRGPEPEGYGLEFDAEDLDPLLDCLTRIRKAI